MEQELADYIFNYCSEFYTEAEWKAKNHYFGQVKFSHWPEHSLPQVKAAKESFRTDDPEALKLLENGYQKFVLNTAVRIYETHQAELNLNRCPKCNKIARTPQAKQCRFCGNSWREVN